jgi:AmiR/NasT family two-component response regulator
LDEREAEDLLRFCRALARDSAPVVALLDYPRRSSYDHALQCGAATVLGKPWRTEELIAAIEMAIAQFEVKRAA